MIGELHLHQPGRSVHGHGSVHVPQRRHQPGRYLRASANGCALPLALTLSTVQTKTYTSTCPAGTTNVAGQCTYASSCPAGFTNIGGVCTGSYPASCPNGGNQNAIPGVCVRLRQGEPPALCLTSSPAEQLVPGNMWFRDLHGTDLLLLCHVPQRLQPRRVAVHKHGAGLVPQRRLQCGWRLRAFA